MRSLHWSGLDCWHPDPGFIFIIEVFFQIHRQMKKVLDGITVPMIYSSTRMWNSWSVRSWTLKSWWRPPGPLHQGWPWPTGHSVDLTQQRLWNWNFLFQLHWTGSGQDHSKVLHIILKSTDHCIGVTNGIRVVVHKGHVRQLPIFKKKSPRFYLSYLISQLFWCVPTSLFTTPCNPDHQEYQTAWRALTEGFVN